MREGKICFDLGNRALAEGAIAAGARFYAGYPITPSTEIAEIASERLPQVGGTYVQMEDEIGSIAAIIGASAAGKKSFTATSGPGFSLMQENLGVAVNVELPCVIVDVQRSGPSTGLATKAAQGDVMQSRFGTHGDSEHIVLSPSSGQECYDYMITAFNLAEKYRTPVIMLADKYVAHLRESFVMWEPGEGDIVNRRRPTCDAADYQPHGYKKYADGVAELADFGDEKYLTRFTSTTHDAIGEPCGKAENTIAFLNHYMDKIADNVDDIVITNRYEMDDAEYVIVAYGCSVRSALGAMEIGRAAGMKIGVLQMVTVWPFGEKVISEVCDKAKAVIVPEMNLGQYVREVQRVNAGRTKVIPVNRIDTEIITPQEILAAIKEA